MSRNLAAAVREHVAACFPGIWIRSHEHDDAEAEITRLCHGQGWQLATWDVDRGLSTGGAADSSATDPLATLRALPGMASKPAPAEAGGTTILLMRNLHRFLGSPDIVQALDTQLSEGKARRTFVLILAPIVDIPAEIERQIIVIEHDLPGRDQLEAIARGVATEPGDLPDGPQLAALLDASAGLTRMEAEGAYSLSLVRHGRIRPEEVWDLKAQALKKSGLMSLHRGHERFTDLGGLDALKSFCLRSLRPPNNQNGGSRTARPRGILLLGVPGTGKSALAKALGNETGRPTLTLDIGALMGSLVGQTESNVREALRIIDAMAPAILFIDEIEKGLSGVAASSNTDSGVSARLFGTLLTWMNDHESDVFMIATSNDVSRLPPEFTRAERFDALYFLDFPGPDQKEQIWRLHMEAFGIEHTQPRPRDTDWTGAEIKACCRLAALLDVPLTDAARNVVPIAATAAENVQRLRTWANGRCLCADRSGLYQSTAATAKPGKSARKIERPTDPELN
jgi:hypothetical protein